MISSQGTPAALSAASSFSDCDSGTIGSASPWMIKNGGAFDVTQCAGLTSLSLAITSDGSALAPFRITKRLTCSNWAGVDFSSYFWPRNSKKSVGGKNTPAALTDDLSSQVRATSEARCPPADAPVRPSRVGSILYSSAWSLTQATP